MGFFSRIFGGHINQKEQPTIKFGRYSDAYKTPEQYKAWDLSLSLFDKGKYLDAYESFFEYLSDEEEENVHWTCENGVCRFEILQGSKRITGVADAKKIKVETVVAKTEALNVGFLRRLIESNFDLKYSRYALDEHSNIVMVFDTYTLDGSPYKLYFAIKELATNSDKQDDLLTDEFETVHLSDTGILQPISDVEKEVKFHFFRKKINEVLNIYQQGKLNPQQYPGAYAYLFLNLSYKLDYLTKPEGFAMEALERMHRMYFAKDGKTNVHKNQMLQKEFKVLSERNEADFAKEFYNVTSTFGITSPVNHEKVVSFIDGELHHMEWYKENGHTEIALSIPGYIVGYCLFNYAVPLPDRQLFYLFYQILEVDYFKALGFDLDYYNEDGSLNKRAIKRAIDQIEDQNENVFPNFNPNTKILEYQSIVDFSASYLKMIRALDLTKITR